MKSKLSAIFTLLTLLHITAGFAGVEEATAAYNKQNYSLALSEVSPLAAQGNAAAQNLLGKMYNNGNGIMKDQAQAVAWYRKAAEQGHAAAQNNLGVAYYNGDGVPQDYAQAVAWYRKAAEQGVDSAQLNLAIAYEYGNGIPQNYSQAVAWYLKAAEQGMAVAQFNLAVIYNFGKGVPKDQTQAVAWYRKAAEQGFADAQFNLGTLYEKGQGVPQDYAQAVAWYRKAAEQENTGAQYNLGVMYYKGKGVPQSYAQALAWYSKAAEHNHADAQYNLGYMYGTGMGVPKDYAIAAEWYRKAATNGNENAKNNLRIVEELLIAEAPAKQQLKDQEAASLINQLSSTPQHCQDADFVIVTCTNYESLQKQLIAGGWCYEKVASSRLDAGYNWQKCRNSDPDLTAKAIRMRKDTSLKKAYVFFSSDYIPALGEKINKDKIQMALYFSEKCKLPISERANLHNYRYTDRSGVQEGCWGELLNGMFVIIDRLGYSNQIPPAALGIAAITKNSDFYFVEESSVIKNASIR